MFAPRLRRVSVVIAYRYGIDKSLIELGIGRPGDRQRLTMRFNAKAGEHVRI